MPKPLLQEPFRSLEQDVIAVLLAGLKQWRPDLDYPESMSDMQACARNLMAMFEIKRRLVPIELLLDKEIKETK